MGNRITDLKENIVRTGGAWGIFMNKELLKNSKRRRASKFTGTFKADSLIVKILFSLRTRDVCTEEKLQLDNNLVSV